MREGKDTTSGEGQGIETLGQTATRQFHQGLNGDEPVGVKVSMMARLKWNNPEMCRRSQRTYGVYEPDAPLFARGGA